ncbi:MAG: hypothetical protein EAS48_02230 [Chryseobacterium sp.]|nr:MAG: hypothetical protein EAS48_02230 [Chryseobacterium sp.]
MVQAQVRFEKAYFIDNDNRRHEVLIKNNEWLNNPSAFEYRANSDQAIKTNSIENAKMFGFYDGETYLRADVDIDRSSSDLKQLSSSSKPQFNTEQLFLRQLSDGKAKLYVYRDGNLVRYFYAMDNQVPRQLIYKPYSVDEVTVGYNTEFRRQLEDLANCPSMNIRRINRTEYTERSLQNLFNEYNNCTGTETSANANIQEKRTSSIHLAARPRVNFSKMTAASGNLSYEVDGKIGFGLGLEAEYILPFNKGKWGALFEPTYASYKSDGKHEAVYASGGMLTSKADYQTIELAFGVRHYMFLNNDSKFFFNFLAVPQVDLDSKFTLNRNDGSQFRELEISGKLNFALGAGYKYGDRYSLELRYFTPRNNLQDYMFWSGKFNSLSLILGYNFF